MSSESEDFVSQKGHQKSDRSAGSEKSEARHVDDNPEARKEELIKIRHELKAEENFELSDDFYSLTFSAYLKENAQKFKLNTRRQARYFQSCMWVFMLQTILLMLILDDKLI